MNGRVTVDIVNDGRFMLFQFVLGCDPDVAEHGTGEPGEETLDEIGPGAVLGREHECEATVTRSGESGLGLSGDVGGMSAAEEPDCGGIELSAKHHELARATAFLDTGMNRAGLKIDAGRWAPRAVSDIFMLAHETSSVGRARSPRSPVPAGSRMAFAGYAAASGLVPGATDPDARAQSTSGWPTLLPRWANRQLRCAAGSDILIIQ